MAKRTEKLESRRSRTAVAVGTFWKPGRTGLRPGSNWNCWWRRICYVCRRERSSNDARIFLIYKGQVK